MGADPVPQTEHCLMSLKLQYEVISLREKIAELAAAIEALMARMEALESKRTLHLKDAKRG